jgi:hypothetical protein
VSAGALEAIDRVLNRGADADDIRRAVVGLLVARGGCAWAGILLVEDGELALVGPQAGKPRPAERMQLPVVFQGERVAELAADGCEDRAFLERVAVIVSPHCLAGADTGGIPWEVP